MGGEGLPPIHHFFSERPFTVVWEATRACDLKCLHCRAEAQPHRHPLELTTAEVRRLIDMVVDFGRPYPLFIVTGGDPLKRDDLEELVAYAVERGLNVAVTPSTTPLATKQRLRQLQQAGCHRIAISVDGGTERLHDWFRGQEGSWRHALRVIEACHELGIELQIHTTVTKHVLGELEQLAKRLVEEWRPVMWALFMLITVGRAGHPRLRKLNLTPHEMERVFEWLAELSEEVPFRITTREGYHYRRVVLTRIARRRGVPVARLLEAAEQMRLPASHSTLTAPHGRMPSAPIGVNDGRGIVFVSHTGEVQPSGFLPLSGGNIRNRHLVDIYRHSPLFCAVRDYTRLQGKCGRCEFKWVCGGSRARAWALTGDFLRADPYCVYQPLRSSVSE